ncbi:hypothetical protein HG530_009883 [Fusarium avenaceum]|nr:hypothetical protein HG530_009883 [Fusarium avenaceum]
MLGDRGGCVSISLSLSGHTVHALLVELGDTLGLGSVGVVHNTVVATAGCGSTACRSAQRADTLARSATIDIHGIGLVEGVLELGERLLHELAGDDGLVLEALLHAGLVADELLLLADELGLAQDISLLIIVNLLFGLVEALFLEFLLLFLKSQELGLNVRIDKVVDILAVVELRNLVVLPLRVLEHIVGLHVNVEHTGTTVLVLLISGESSALGILLVVLLTILSTLRNECLQSLTTHGLSDVNTGHNISQSAANISAVVGASLELLVHTLGDQALASGVLDFLDTLLGVARQLEELDLAGLEDSLKLSLNRRLEVLGPGHVNLVNDNKDKLVGEEGLDALEEGDLSTDSVSTLL